ncbi:glycosyltransferase [Streptomyces sp. ISL-11]|uniref:glycosyltransferase n=1 Tax=Streptomyces sp. ISL-11 TaxID=2819174 RepID=UPI001BEB6FE2|nr:glycosyltransferase [Streptomyces sp. ISL-11]MBT2383228.1 glycosyltransferase [Streptomyces sp. ISL-11]
MKISLLTFGTRGDVHPFIALGAGLVARGHEVALATSADFREMVEKAGLNFREIPGSGKDYFATPAVVDSIRKSPSSIRTALKMPKPSLDEVVESMERMYEAGQDADFMLNALITRGVGYAGPGVPWGTVSWWPITATGEFRAYNTPDLPLGAPWTRFTHFMSAQMEWQWNRPAVNRFRKRRGLPALGMASPAARLGTDQPILYPYSPSFMPPPRDWPQRAHVTGYWTLDRTTEPPADLVEFLDSGPAPVVLALGSAWPVYGERTLELVRDAVRKAKRRLVVVGGPEGDLPDDEFRTGEVDYGWLFPRAAAVIHGASFGTTADVLRAGVPQVTVPCWADGPYWAARLAALGVSAPPVPFQKLTGGALTQAVAQAVDEPGIAERAARLGELVRADRGVETACDLIEQWGEARPA